MDGFQFPTVTLWIVAVLTWIVVMMGVAQLSRFYTKFREARRELDANLLGMAGQLKKMQTTLTELLVEQRRLTRLQVELLDLKRAELTGDFEIVEEPVAPAAAPAEKEESPEPPPIKRPPEKFPKII
ncbi:hypothetical protein [uncultured Victivallis sp.]|uniref:hypothetical protein n=1 Tax=uncultured Victivallis sp. TaxID=354118 RepID=UPI0025E09E95|nr:hypothetical protein [uncultured Victivallis sp.]